MNGIRLHIAGWMWVAVAGVCVGAGAQENAPAPVVKASKYPLRLHVLAADEFHATVRFQPQYDSANAPDVSTGVATGGGGGGTSSYTTFGGDDDFSGKGRGDLVSPPTLTQGVSFSYDGCSRMRVLAGFQSLKARWKVEGKKLEVLLPTDALPKEDKPAKTQRCTLKVTMHEFVYLRVRSGKLIQVSQADYWSKPSLRVFLSGGTQTLQERPGRTALKPDPPPELPDSSDGVAPLQKEYGAFSLRLE